MKTIAAICHIQYFAIVSIEKLCRKNKLKIEIHFKNWKTAISHVTILT